MFFRKAFLFASCIVGSLIVNAQEYVQNGGFEELRTDIKGKGSIKASKYWISTTKVQADLFSKIPNDKIEPLYEGLKTDELPSKGEQFTGLVAFSYLGQEPRSYVSNLLKKPLRSGDKYCFSIDVMLHKNAKYHTTDLAMIATTDDIGYEEEVNLLEENAVHLKFDEEINPGRWVKAYAGFIADGDGLILNIGNFTSDTKTSYSQIEKKSSQSLSGQLPVAYYFIDNVSLVEVKSLEQCSSLPTAPLASNNGYGKGVKRNVVKKDDFSRAALPEKSNVEIIDDSPPEVVGDEALGEAMRDENTLVFLEYSAGLDNNLYDKIDDLLSKENFQTLTLVARTSYDEALASQQNRMLRSLSNKRLLSVTDYLTRKGISRDRIQMVDEPYNAAKLQGGSPTVSFIFNP